MANEFFSNSGEFIGEFPEDCVLDCSAAGDVLESVNYWINKLQFEVPREQAVKWLKETGAWDAEELDEMSGEELARKVLWLACCDIKENGEWFGLIN